MRRGADLDEPLGLGSDDRHQRPLELNTLAERGPLAHRWPGGGLDDPGGRLASSQLPPLLGEASLDLVRRRDLPQRLQQPHPERLKHRAAGGEPVVHDGGRVVLEAPVQQGSAVVDVTLDGGGEVCGVSD